MNAYVCTGVCFEVDVLGHAQYLKALDQNRQGLEGRTFTFCYSVSRAFFCLNHTSLTQNSEQSQGCALPQRQEPDLSFPLSLETEFVNQQNLFNRLPNRYASANFK